MPVFIRGMVAIRMQRSFHKETRQPEICSQRTVSSLDHETEHTGTAATAHSSFGRYLVWGVGSSLFVARPAWKVASKNKVQM